jgi:hypothetical protein
MLKYTLLVSSLATLLFSSCGQQMKMVKTAPTDSLAVESVWKQYVKAISGKNIKTLKKLSLNQVYCQPCAIQTGTGDLVTADAFAKNIFSTLTKTKLWSALKTGKHLIVTEKIKNYKPLNLDVPNNQALEVYDVWFVTKGLPDKIKGFESQRYAFQFVKQQGRYKFFGLTAVQ